MNWGLTKEEQLVLKQKDDLLEKVESVVAIEKAKKKQKKLEKKKLKEEKKSLKKAKHKKSFIEKLPKMMNENAGIIILCGAVIAGLIFLGNTSKNWQKI